MSLIKSFNIEIEANTLSLIEDLLLNDQMKEAGSILK
jgi:hypothetical protein